MTTETTEKKTVQDFLTEQEKAKNSIETLRQRIRQSYDKALEGTKEGHYVQLNKLKDEDGREEFKNALISGLTDPLQASIAAMPEDPSFAESLAMHGFYGFGTDAIVGLVNGLKENLTFDNYMKNLSDPKQTELQDAIGRRAQATGNVLDKVSTEDVLGYVGVDVEDPSKITLKDKAELVALKEEHGVVPPKSLEEKLYM